MPEGSKSPKVLVSARHASFACSVSALGSTICPLQLGEGETLAFSIAQPCEHACGTVERWSLLNLVLGWFIDRDRFVDARSSRWVQLRNLYLHGAAFGGLIGIARGFARYLQALLGRDDYLSAGSRALLFTPALGPGGSELPRSVGWFTGQLNGEAYYTHAGGAAGYYCELRVYPRIGPASVVMLNRTGIRDERALDAIDAFFLADHGVSVVINADALTQQ